MNYMVTISLPSAVFDSQDLIKWLFGGTMHVLSGLGHERVEQLISKVLVEVDNHRIKLPINEPDDIKILATIILLIGTVTGVRGTVQRADSGEGNLVGFLRGWGLDIDDGSQFDF